MKYDVICSNSVDELVKFVNNKLKRGWKCQGGIGILLEPPRYSVFYQAIIKDETNEKLLPKASK
jgi:hypothetical protein